MTVRDTSPQARQVQLESLRRLGVEGRLAQAPERSEQAREIAVRGWLDRNPQWSRARARAAMLRRVLGARLYEAAYGGDGDAGQP